MPVRNAKLDDDVKPLIKYADEHIGTWVPVEVEDYHQFARTVRWFVNSKESPFGWSPEGRPQTATRSFDLMWRLPGDDQWTRDINVPGVFKGNFRVGRLKLRIKGRRTDADDGRS